jgi:glycosyltransferase involved in cell wall biosynthesis
VTRSVTFVVPGSLATRTGGYEYDRRMIDALRGRNWAVAVRELAGEFPHASTSARSGAASTLAACPDGTVVVIDGLALGALPAEVEREAARLLIVALVHMPLADETGLSQQQTDEFRRMEQRALAACRLVIATGHSTVDTIVAYGIDRARIVVVEPGTDRAPLARGSRSGSVHLVSVATVHAGKGHELLVRALASVPTRNWRLTIAGSLERDRAAAERLRAAIAGARLEDHVHLTGEADAAGVAALYDDADAFVLATLKESYGMAVLDALARGLPIVSTTTGAIPSLVGGDAGILVPPGDIDALTRALSQVIDDEPLRRRLAEGARRVRDRLPTWDVAGDRLSIALEQIVGNERVAF